MDLESFSNVLASVLHVYPHEITADTTFQGDLGADSLDLYQIILAVEKELSVELPTEGMDKLTTVGEALQFLNKNI